MRSGYFNSEQEDHMAWLHSLPPSAKCFCGWYLMGECTDCKKSYPGLTCADKCLVCRAPYPSKRDACSRCGITGRTKQEAHPEVKRGE